MAAKALLDDAADQGVLPRYAAWNQRLKPLKFRPDFVFLTPSKIVIIEIDENGHKGYCPEKEREREEAIHNATKRKCIIYRTRNLTEEDIDNIQALLG